MSDALSVFYRSGIRVDQCSTVVFIAKARGDPGLIRTGDLRFRKPPLYPPELRGRTALVCSTKPTRSRTAEVAPRILDARTAQRETDASGCDANRPIVPPRMTVLAPVLEIKRTLRGVEKRFECRLLTSGTGHAVVLWIAPEPMHVHGVDLPAGTVSFGHFWEGRGYNVYHWLDPAGKTLGYYFNIADETCISAEVIAWRDLVLDVLMTPDGRCDVLDEDELPPDLDPALRARVEAGLRAILDNTASVLAEVDAASLAVAPLVFPGAE